MLGRFARRGSEIGRVMPRSKLRPTWSGAPEPVELLLRVRRLFVGPRLPASSNSQRRPQSIEVGFRCLHCPLRTLDFGRCARRLGLGLFKVLLSLGRVDAGLVTTRLS